MTPWLRQTLHNNMQLKLYARAVQLLHGRLPHRVVLESISTGEAAELTPTAEVVAEADRVLAQTAANIRARRFHPTPSAVQCRFCPFASVCDHAVVVPEPMP
jgi:CRISPR/Cas system-associated exonuclease Cas4 (RecB family)